MSIPRGQDNFRQLACVTFQAIQQLSHERGFVSPFSVTWVASTTWMVYFEWEDVSESEAGITEVFYEHEPDNLESLPARPRLPLHGLIVDSTGQGAHLTFTWGGTIDMRP